MTIGTTRFFGNNSELFSKLNSELQSLQTQAGTGKAELKLANNIGDISKLSAAEEKKSETNQLLSNSQRAQTDLEVMDVAFEFTLFLASALGLFRYAALVQAFGVALSSAVD